MIEDIDIIPYTTGYLNFEKEDRNRFIFTTLHKIKLQMDTGSQHKMKYTKPDRRKMRDNLELIDTGKLLKQTPLAQTLRTSNK